MIATLINSNSEVLFGGCDKWMKVESDRKESSSLLRK